MIAAAGVIVSACSPVSPAGPFSEFPRVLDRPEQRADQPMTAEQVKQATDDLTAAGKRLSASNPCTQPNLTPAQAQNCPPPAPPATAAAAAKP